MKRTIKHHNRKEEIDDTINSDIISKINENKKNNSIYSMLNIKYLKDNSYDVFNTIFNNMEFENIKGQKLKINDIQDFNKYQTELNSNYKSKIKLFEYKDKKSMFIIKEIPYKSTKLRKISEDDTAISISPNGIFARTSQIENNSESSLAHYNTVIGNAIITKGAYYYEVKILELGEDTDLFFGIISKDCEVLKNNKYRHFPIGEFKDAYAFNFNNHYTLKYNNNKKELIKEGDCILIKINLTKKYICFYINGNKFKKNKISIENEKCGYYPAFSLSNEKEIEVNFGGMYEMIYTSSKGNQLNKKPICQYNNLEKIVSCYMKIIENNLIKIINHNQISFNDSIRFFYPMLNFFAKIAFNDEYIMKNYILKFMYEKSKNNMDIYNYFNNRYNLIYLIIQNIELDQQKQKVLFLLDCLCEEIKYNSYDKMENECKFEKWNILIKLYNYFLQRKLFQEILFNNNDKNNNETINSIKNQLYIIFKSVKLFGINKVIDNSNIFNKYSIKTIINGFMREEYNKKIDNLFMLNTFKELINTLLFPVLKYPKYNTNEFDKLINNINNDNEIICVDNKIKEENNSIKTDDIMDNFNILKKYLFKKENNFENNGENNTIDEDDLNINKNENNLIYKKRIIEKNYYKKILFDLILDIYNSNSNNDKFNFILTIFFPLIYLFNDIYEKESSTNLVNTQLLSFLPFIAEDYNNLIELSFELFLSKNLINNNELLTKLINPKMIYTELFQKKYNVSSYILKIIIYILSFIGDDFDIYNDYKKYRLKLNNINFSDNENNELNHYYYECQKIVLIFSKSYSQIIIKAINILIPYLKELLNNQFFLFLPYISINGIKLLIKYIFEYSFINKDLGCLKENNIRELIQIFIDLNMKILDDDNINQLYIDKAILNIYLLFDYFNKIKKICDDDEENNLDSINNYFGENQFKTLFNIIKKKYKNEYLKKSFINFILYFSSDSYLDNKYFSSYLLKYIILDEDEFWFKEIIIEYLKKKLITKITKLSNIINGNINEYNKLEKYLTFLFSSLCFFCNYLDNKEFIEKLFLNNIDLSDLDEIDDKKSKTYNEMKKNDEFPLYYLFIHIISLIINNILNENYFVLYKKEMNLNINGFSNIFGIIIVKSIIFFKTIIISIPNKYQKILDQKEKEKNKKNKKCKKEKKTNANKDNNEVNEDIKQYYINIINKLTKNNFAKLICLMEKYNNDIDIVLDDSLCILKEIIVFLNDIQNKYNTTIINSEEEKEIEKTCPICLDNYSDIHVSPCGHTFCWTCIQKITNDICPICRKKMNGVLEHSDFNFNRNINNRENNANPFISPFIQRRLNNSSNVDFFPAYVNPFLNL